MWTSWETRCGIAAYTGALVGELRSLGIEVEIVPVPYTERDPQRMGEILARLNAADLVHLQHEYTFFGGIVPGASTLPWYQRRLRVPRVVTAHTVFTAAELLRLPQEERPRQRLAKRLLAASPQFRRSVESGPFEGAEAVIVHTEAARERLAKRRIRPERVHVLPGGIPTAAAPDPAELAALRERLGLEGKRVVTIFGYVTPDKGYETALLALKSLPPAVKLLVAGGTRVEHERAYMDQLRAEIRTQGLDERVAITGYLEEPQLAAAMALTDLVLVPHLTANGSYSVMVALSHGKPVLASDLPCFSELRQSAECVELFPVGDERSLAERLGFLLASGGARKAMAGAAREYAVKRSWGSVAESTVAIYRSAVTSARR